MPRLPMKKIFLLLAALAIAYFLYMRFFAAFGPAMPEGGASPVSVAVVEEREIQQWHEFSGRLTAVDQAAIRPQVSGVIQSIHFENGQMVEKGELLFVIDPRPYEAALQAASASGSLAESEFKRAETLLKENAISQRDYDQRKNAAAVARAELTRARLNLAYTKIEAPISGRVGRAEITEGNLVEVNAGAPVLTTIVSSAPIYADFEIDEKTYLSYAGQNAVGRSAQSIPVMIELGGAAEPRVGRVESFDNRLDPASGTLRVRAIFENADGALVPGLFVRVKLGSPAPEKTLLITDRAVGTDQSKKFVYVVGEDNTAAYREIALGGVAGGLRVVESGLKPGEKIVVSGMQRVRPGAPVVPEVVPMENQESGIGHQESEKSHESH